MSVQVIERELEEMVDTKATPEGVSPFIIGDGDLDKLGASACACDASDDNPY